MQNRLEIGGFGSFRVQSSEIIKILQTVLLFKTAPISPGFTLFKEKICSIFLYSKLHMHQKFSKTYATDNPPLQYDQSIPIKLSNCKQPVLFRTTVFTPQRRISTWCRRKQSLLTLKIDHVTMITLQVLFTL